MIHKKMLAIRVEPHCNSISYADLEALLSLDSTCVHLLSEMHQFPTVEFRLYGGTVDKLETSRRHNTPLDRINDLDFIAVVDSKEAVTGFMSGHKPKHFGPQGKTGFTISYKGYRNRVPVDVSFTFYFASEFNPDTRAVFDTVGMSEYIPIPKKGELASLKSHYHDSNLVTFCRENRLLLSPKDLDVRFMSLRNYMRQAKGWRPISKGYARRVHASHVQLCSNPSINLTSALDRTMLAHFELSDLKGKEAFLSLCIQATKQPGNSQATLPTQIMIHAAEALGFLRVDASTDLQVSSNAEDLAQLSSAWRRSSNTESKVELASLVLELLQDVAEDPSLTISETRLLFDLSLSIRAVLDLEKTALLSSRLQVLFDSLPLAHLETYVKGDSHERPFLTQFFDAIYTRKQTLLDLSDVDQKAFVRLAAQSPFPFFNTFEERLSFVEALYPFLTQSELPFFNSLLRDLVSDTSFPSFLDAYESGPKPTSLPIVTHLLKQYLSVPPGSVALLPSIYDMLAGILPKNLGRELVVSYLEHLVHARNNSSETALYEIEDVLALWDRFPRVVSPRLFDFVTADGFFEAHVLELSQSLHTLQSRGVKIPESLRHQILNHITTKDLEDWSSDDYRIWSDTYVPGCDVASDFIGNSILYFSNRLERIEGAFTTDLVVLAYDTDLFVTHQDDLRRIVSELIKINAAVPEHICDALGLDRHNGNPIYESESYYYHQPLPEKLIQLSRVQNAASQLKGFAALLRVFDNGGISLDKPTFFGNLDHFISEQPELSRPALIQHLVNWIAQDIHDDLIRLDTTIVRLFSDCLVLRLKPKSIVITARLLYERVPDFMNQIDTASQSAVLSAASTAPKVFAAQFKEATSTFIGAIRELHSFSDLLSLLSLLPAGKEKEQLTHRIITSIAESDKVIPDTLFPVIFESIKQFNKPSLNSQKPHLMLLLKKATNSNCSVKGLLVATSFDRDIVNYAYDLLEESGPYTLFNDLKCDEAIVSQRYFPALLRFNRLTDIVSTKYYLKDMPEDFIWDVLANVTGPDQQSVVNGLEEFIKVALTQKPHAIIDDLLPLFNRQVNVRSLVQSVPDIHSKIKWVLHSEDLDTDTKQRFIKLIATSFSKSVFRKACAEIRSSGIPLEGCNLTAEYTAIYKDYVTSTQRAEEAPGDEPEKKVSETYAQDLKDVQAKLTIRRREIEHEIEPVKMILKESIHRIHSGYSKNVKSFARLGAFKDDWQRLKSKLTPLSDNARKQLYKTPVMVQDNIFTLCNAMFWMKDSELITDAVGLKILDISSESLRESYPDFFRTMLYGDDLDFLKTLVSLGLPINSTFNVRKKNDLQSFPFSLYISAVGHEAKACSEYLLTLPDLHLETEKNGLFDKPSQIQYMLTTGLLEGLTQAHAYNKISSSSEFVKARTFSFLKFLVFQGSDFKDLNAAHIENFKQALTFLVEHHYIDLAMRFKLNFEDLNDLSLIEFVAHLTHTNNSCNLLSAFDGISQQHFPSPRNSSHNYSKFLLSLLSLATSSCQEVAALGISFLRDKASVLPDDAAFRALLLPQVYERTVETFPEIVQALFHGVDVSADAGDHMYINHILTCAKEDHRKELIDTLNASGYVWSLDDIKVFICSVKTDQDLEVLEVGLQNGRSTESHRNSHLMGLAMQLSPMGYKLKICELFSRSGIRFLTGDDVNRRTNPLTDFYRQFPGMGQVIPPELFGFIAGNRAIFPSSFYAAKYATSEEFRLLMEMGMPVTDSVPNNVKNYPGHYVFKDLYDCILFYYQNPQTCRPNILLTPDQYVTFKCDMGLKLRFIRPEVDPESLPMIRYCEPKLPYFSII